MSYKMKCCMGSMIVALVLTTTLFAFILSLHKENYFYCYFFDSTRFYKANTIDKIKNLYSKMKLSQNEKLIFDYVIIGAGTAGSIIANRLSEDNSDEKILVIEAGKNMNGNFFKEIPGIAPFTWSNSYGNFTWDYMTTQQQYMNNRRFKLPAGKMIGGTSSNNFMIYSQVFSKNYDKWSEVSGCENWSWNNVGDYFFHIQNSVTPVKSTKLGRLWHKAWKNEPSKFQEDGMKFFIKAGLRWDVSKEYLYIASRRSNVKILTDTFVKSLVFNQGTEKRVSSVEIENNGEIKDIHVRKSVILSAGVVQNVRILKQSMSTFDHDVCEMIGKKLKDHIFIPLFFETLASETFGYSSSTGSMIAYFWKYLFSSDSVFAQTMIDSGQLYFDTKITDSNWTLVEFSPNIQVALISSLIDETSLEKIFSKYLDPSVMDIYKRMVNRAKTKNGFTVFVILVDPLSEDGSIDFKTQFEINPGYLSNKQDTITLLHGLQRVFNVIYKADELKELNLNLLKPFDNDDEFIGTCNQTEIQEIASQISDGDKEFNKNYWICYIKQVGHSIFHYHGSVRFGATSEFPLDCNLKLRNTTNVYVVDASVIPSTVSGGLQSVVYMIAEKFSRDLTAK